MRVYTDVLLLALLLPLQIANTLDSQARDDNLDDNLNVARRIREGTTNSDRLFVGKASFRLGLAQHTSLQEFLDGPKSLLSCCLSFEWCGEGELRTPKHDDRKSFFLIYLYCSVNSLIVKIGGKNARMK